ncbi:Clr5 domain-containing protein [Dactylonectria estremocensis]|uniref:Clr5 domain-containing protein n=1 Tax=Dactylonectria estremocensis TaxID=1079267 RepID=A0A9P9EMX1_9HYPO|nr:Clr5 domain-containing protein [Dactylonectria estremocensis]
MNMSTNAYREDQWDVLRPHITRLYFDESRPLRDVVQTIRDKYGFDATPRMYKYRLQKWGLDKKFKEKEVAQMVLLKQQRDAAGKKTKFLIQGKTIDWDLVERYLHRRPDLQTRIRAGMIAMGDTIPGLVCRSPSPDRVRHASPVLQHSDEMLRLLKGYYESTFGLDTASRRSSVSASTDLAISIRCFRQLDQARIMITSENMKVGFGFLNKSLDDLRHLVRMQDPTLLFYLFDVALAFDPSHRELARAVLRHTHDIVIVTLGHSHPLVRLLRRLSHLQGEDRYDVIVTILEGVVGTFKQFGSNDRVLKRLNCHYFLLLDYLGLYGKRANPSFPEMDANSIDDVGVAYLARFVDRLISNEDPEEAELKLAMVLTWVQAPVNLQHPSWPELQLSYYRLRLHTHLARGQWDESSRWFEKLLAHSGKYSLTC